MNANHSQFLAALVAAYTELFASDPNYAFSASKMTPTELADKMFSAVLKGSANVTGPGFRLACKACGIKHTGRAIDAFLGNAAPTGTAVIMTPKRRKVSALILSGVQSAMTGVFRINYAHGLITLDYTDGSREAGTVSEAKWSEIGENPFAIVSLVQSQRVPTNS